MRITCPECRTPLGAADVNLDHLVGRCVPCDQVFSVAGQVGRHAPPPRRRPELPRGISIERGEPPLPATPGEGYREAAGARPDPGELLVRRRWLRAQHFFLLFFCIAWDGFLVFWYVGITGSGDAPWLHYVFPIAHIAAGAFLTYQVLTGFLNTTRVRIAGGTLSVRHGPLPWPGNRDLPVASLRQLTVRRKVTHGRKGGSRIAWAVHAETEDHTDVPILTGLESEEQARYLEWVIEDHLGIEDRPGDGD